MRFSGSGMGVFRGRDRYMTLAIFTQADPPIALEILVDEGRLVWPDVGGNKPAPDGWPTQTLRQVLWNDSDHLSSPHPSDTRYGSKGPRTAVPPISRWYDSSPYHLVPPVPLPVFGAGLNHVAYAAPLARLVHERSALDDFQVLAGGLVLVEMAEGNSNLQRLERGHDSLSLRDALLVVLRCLQLGGDARG